MHFNVRPTKLKNERTIIYAVVRVNGVQHRVPTNLHVYAKQWDKKNELCRTLSTSTLLDERNNAEANAVLAQLRSTFIRAKTAAANDEKCWNDTACCVGLIRKYLSDTLIDNGITVRTKTTAAKSLDVVEWLIKRVQDDTTITDGTRGMYTAKLHVLQTYARRPITAFTTLANNDYLQAFYEWLLTEHKANGVAIQTSTANEIIAVVIRTLRRYCLPEKVLTKSQVTDLYVNKLKSDTNKDEIALSDTEVLAIYGVQTSTPLERTVKDLFVLNCLTGQRISDTKQLIDSYTTTAEGRGCYHIVQRKTKATVECPVIYKLADTILKKYHTNEFYMPTHQEFNAIIKDLAKRAHIDEYVQQFKQYGKGKTQITQIPKYQAISTHTARRTFITLAALRGWTAHQIREYSGHTDTAMVDLYTKTNPLQRATFNDLPEEKRLQMY